MVTVKVFTFNEFQENTYLLFDETLACIVIDPGMNNDSERKQFDEFISTRNLNLISILNTHCHVDHVISCKYVKEKYAVPFYVHKNEVENLENATLFGEFFGISIDHPPVPDNFISEHDIIPIGKTNLKVIFVPGHSAGSLAFYCMEDNILITGDVLFKGTIGRTDLPGGHYNTLIDSIQSKIMTLPDNTLVFPGHGPSTTIEEERHSNPFLS